MVGRGAVWGRKILIVRVVKLWRFVSEGREVLFFDGFGHFSLYKNIDYYEKRRSELFSRLAASASHGVLGDHDQKQQPIILCARGRRRWTFMDEAPTTQCPT